MKVVVSSITRGCEWALRQPLVWGGLACLAFYALAVDRLDEAGMLRRLVDGAMWPWQAAIFGVFCVGAAQLVMKALGVVVEFGGLRHHGLPAASGDVQAQADAERFLGLLESAPATFRKSYLGQRLGTALRWIKLRRSAGDLDGYLARLAADDRTALQHGYAGVRASMISLVILGLLGLLFGASGALARSSGVPADETLPKVLGGLSAAVDPCVEALGLALVLALAKIGVSRFETRLLAEVDRVVDTQLLARFGQYGFDRDPHSASIARMSAEVLQTVSAAAAQHDAALAKALTNANRRWEEMANSAAALVQRTLNGALAAGLKEHGEAISGGVAKLASALEGVVVRHATILNEGVDNQTASLAEALEHHAAVLTAAERSLAEENRRHLAEVEASVGEAMVVAATRQEKLVQQSEDLVKELQVALVEAADAAISHQEQLVKQSELLLKVTEASGQIRRLEESLNGNLAALTATSNFEETAASLAASVQLLAARLKTPSGRHPSIDLGGDGATSQAA